MPMQREYFWMSERLVPTELLKEAEGKEELREVEEAHGVQCLPYSSTRAASCTLIRCG